MIGTIRRHQQWLWIVVIIATIGSFLFYFSPSNRNGNSTNGGGNTGEANLGSIFGQAVTPEQLQAAEREGRIFFRVNYGYWPDTPERKQAAMQYAQQRLFLNAEMNEFHITPTAEAAARFTKRMLGVKPEDNIPTDKILETLGTLSREGQVTLDDFDRYARHMVGLEYLEALVGMSGKLITPQEVEIFFRRSNEPVETELVTFSSSNYFNGAAPTSQELQDFYDKRQADYRLPERIQLNYIAFSASNYTAAAAKQLGTNLDQRVNQQYLQSGATAFKDDKGVQLSADSAKARLKLQMVTYATMIEASKDANSFVNDLSQNHDEAHPYTTNDLTVLAQKRNLTVRTTEPFDARTGPVELAINPKVVRSLFQLGMDDPDDKEHSNLYGSPLAGTNAIYMIGFARRIPSQMQTYAAVSAQVAQDYRRVKALDMARTAASRFQSALEAGMAQGKTFDTMCAAQFIHPQTLAPFSMSSTAVPEVSDKAEFEQLQDYAGKMQAGQCTPFVPTPDGGFILYLKARLPISQDALHQNLPAFVERMRHDLQIAAFNAWFSREYQLHSSQPQIDQPAAGS